MSGSPSVSISRSERFELALTFLRNLLFAVSFAVLGYAIASREVMSHGGLTKVKALLNGIKVPKAVRATTLLCKIFGTTFTVTCGLPAGKLAPLIHCAAIVGGGLSQGKTLKVMDANTSSLLDEKISEMIERNVVS